MTRGGHQTLDLEAPMNSKSISDNTKIPPDVQSGAEVQRPCVSTACLAQNGIRRVNADEAYERAGCRHPGVVIPYFAFQNGGWEPIYDPECRPYCRLRKDSVEGSGKYYQPAESIRIAVSSNSGDSQTHPSGQHPGHQRPVLVGVWKSSLLGSAELDGSRADSDWVNADRFHAPASSTLISGPIPPSNLLPPYPSNLLPSIPYYPLPVHIANTYDPSVMLQLQLQLEPVPPAPSGRIHLKPSSQFGSTNLVQCPIVERAEVATGPGRFYVGTALKHGSPDRSAKADTDRSQVHHFLGDKCLDRRGPDQLGSHEHQRDQKRVTCHGHDLGVLSLGLELSYRRPCGVADAVLVNPARPNPDLIAWPPL